MTETATINTNLCEVLNLAIETFPPEEKRAKGSLHTSDGRYCALGWIGHCMGYSDDDLDKCHDYGEMFRPLGLATEDYVAIYSISDRWGREVALNTMRGILASKGC